MWNGIVYAGFEEIVYLLQGLVGVKFFKNGSWVEVAIDTVIGKCFFICIILC
jgi:hypothetical protein